MAPNSSTGFRLPRAVGSCPSEWREHHRCRLLRCLRALGRRDGTHREIRRNDQVAAGIPDPVALSRHRQPPSGNHDADRVRVRLHACEQKSNRDAAATRPGSFRYLGRSTGRSRRLTRITTRLWNAPAARTSGTSASEHRTTIPRSLRSANCRSPNEMCLSVLDQVISE